MTAAEARNLVLHTLTPRYGAGEAASIARILLEDEFDVKGKGQEKCFTVEELERLSGFLRRLQAGEPLQYLLGEADFFGLRYRVNSAVLIPRQETEELVAWVLKYLNEQDKQPPAVLDIGLGSGCIGITLKYKRPDIQLYGLEKSPDALNLAIENARRILGDAIFSFQSGDILDPLCGDDLPLFDVIVSNPPYIPRKEQSLLPEHVRAHEPALALFVDDDDPLVFYRVIAGFARRKLYPGGALFFECNEFNAPEVADLLVDSGFSGVELRKDISGADRMLVGRIFNSP